MPLKQTLLCNLSFHLKLDFQFGSEIKDAETGFVAFFLWIVIVASLIGICVTGVTLFFRNGIKRPFNQV